MSHLCGGHGGNIYRLAEEIGVREDRVIDFSASINPLGVSERVKVVIKKGLGSIHNYPDPDTKRLCEVIAQHHNIAPETIICGNGSTELIYLTVRAIKPKTVLIPQPTFSEYERACKTAGYKLQVTSYKLKREDDFQINPDEFVSSLITNHSSQPFDMVFLCNPNNPTGNLLEKAEVLKIADAAKKLKCYLIVDEAFIDFCPEDSVITEVKHNPYLIVLRSMTKFYCLAGLRIGYGVFPLSLIERLKGFKEPWTVNTIAQMSAIAALMDREYVRRTSVLMETEKRFLEDGFKRLGIEFFPSSANFYLLRLNRVKRLIHYLKRHGILVRDCSNFRGLDSSYIRVAVKNRKDNMLLLKGLVKFKKERR
ncbi:MAG: histidinol-phosphate transaminase [Thermodesulfovibrionia bacterium]